MGNICYSAEKVPSEPDDRPAEAPMKPPPEDPVQKLTINIMGARGLRNADWLPGMGTSDCYCTVKIPGKEEENCLFQTKTINDTLSPLWQHEEGPLEIARGDSLEFSVWDEDVGHTADFLGKVVLRNEDFAKEGFNGELMLEQAGKNQKAYLRVKVKMDWQTDYPTGPSSELTINIEKEPKGMLGMDVDESDGIYLYVMDVKAGPVQSYNQRVDPSCHVRPGDFLVRINEATGNSKAMVKELKTKTNFEIHLKRPEEVTVAINKGESKNPLGLQLTKKPTGNALLIEKVNPGPFQDWNDAHDSYRVCHNDRVLMVNGFMGKATELQRKMQKETAFQALVVRPADAAKAWWYW